MKKNNLLLISALLATNCHAVSAVDIKDTIDCVSALSVIKSLSEENNNPQMVKKTVQLMKANENKVYSLLDGYIKERINTNQSAILDIQKMTKESFDVYRFKNLLDGSKYAKQVIENNRCLSVEKIYFLD